MSRMSNIKRLRSTLKIRHRIYEFRALIWLTVVKRKKPNLSASLEAVLNVDVFQGTQRGGTYVATVDHSDIRGLVTA